MPVQDRVAVEQAATEALADAGADRWIGSTVSQTTSTTYKQARAGRPGPNTDYREVATTRFTVSHDINLDQIRFDAASDGCFPLITNDHALSDADVLGAYRYQPNLERRHHLLKSVQDAAPVLLHNPARVDATRSQSPASAVGLNIARYGSRWYFGTREGGQRHGYRYCADQGRRRH